MSLLSQLRPNFKLTQMALMLKPIISIANSNELRHLRNDKIELDVKGIIKNCHILSLHGSFLKKFTFLIK